mmetsp:Transcript_26158/g.29309  ORF Transcript_26158/g.29309 Transcript_26158/m.29309 type:complete len:263 (+) Transcript_26158:160-948(+)
MPIVHPTTTTNVLSLIASSPTQSGRQTIHTGNVWMEDVTIELPASMSLVMPVELTNGCTESKCTVESDDVQMTNFLRKHYLEHFGHRDINGMMGDYAINGVDGGATIIHNVTSYDNQKNGGSQEQHTKLKFHGLTEIRAYYTDLVFPVHSNTEQPNHACTFSLESMTIHKNQATVCWTAKTPTLSIVDAIDRYVFNGQGLIVKQFFSCETHERENYIVTPGRRRSLSASSSASVSSSSSSATGGGGGVESSKDYSGFFESEK